MKLPIQPAKYAIHLAAIVAIAVTPALQAADKMKALIVDGQNNHKVWPKSTIMMKEYLEATGLFEVAVARTKYIWSAEREKAFLPLAGVGESEMVKEPQPDPDFKPDFSKYAVVISNFGWKAANWPEETQRAFEKYVEGGGLSQGPRFSHHARPRYRGIRRCRIHHHLSPRHGMGGIRKSDSEYPTGFPHRR